MDSFSSLMEFAVTIAGFSGLTMAFQARNSVVNELQTFRNTMLISFSLAAAFGSVIPAAFAHLGAAGPALWARSSASFSVLCVLLLAAPFAARRPMSREGRGQLSITIWILVVAGMSLVLIAQLLNATGFLGEPGSAPIYLGIIWIIFLSALMYARMLMTLHHSSGE